MRKRKLKKKRIFNNPIKGFLGEYWAGSSVNKTILNQSKKKKDIIYGARSVEAQIGLFSRPTKDWDIFTKKPKKSAMRSEKILDKTYGSNHYYAKPALHPGTWKVMSKGIDGRKGTKDDVGIIDYTKIPRPRPRFVVINGVRFRRISQEKKAKYKALKDKTEKFRHKKDREDLDRIKMAMWQKR